MRVIVRLATVTLPLVLVIGCNKSEPKPDLQTTAASSDHPPTQPTNQAASRELVEHPTYKLWGQFPAGTTVTQRTTTDSELTPGQTVTTIVYTIKERTEDHIIIESQATTTYHGGRVEMNPPNEVRSPRLIPLPPGVNKDAWGVEPKSDQTGEEILTVSGKPYPSRWRKSRSTTDAGEMFTTTWTSSQMPGGLVKSVSQVPAVKETTTIEVIEVKIP
jgi:hypothetical protein